MAGFMKRLAQSMFVNSQRKRAAKRLRNRRLFGQTQLFECLEPRQLLSATTTTHYAHTQYILTQSSNGNKPLASSSPVGLTPTQVRNAYGLNLITFSGGIVGDGTGQTIAIVDAYHDPTILHDLQVFDAAFGLPDPPSFIQVAQNGTTNFPPTDPAGSQGSGGNTWEIETALDVEWAHAMAPGANILLVEATSASDANLIQAAVNYARNYPGVVAVSMSFGGDEDASGDWAGYVFYDSQWACRRDLFGIDWGQRTAGWLSGLFAERNRGGRHDPVDRRVGKLFGGSWMER